MAKFDPIRDAAKSLAAKYPDVARLLVGVDPMTVAAGSHKAYTWRCSVEGSGHPGYDREAYRMTGNQARPEGWCETCAKEEAEARSLGSLYPEVALLLVGVDPKTVAAGSDRTYTWRCSVEGSGHPNYERTARQVTGKKARPEGRCPECAREESEAKSLGRLYLDVARLLVDVDPLTVSAGAHKAFTWQCSVEGSGHPNYERMAVDMTGAKARPEGWCEMCAKEEAEAKSLGSLYPEVALLLVGVDPMTVAAGSEKTYVWRCSVDGSNHPDYERTAVQMTGRKARPEGWCETCAEEALEAKSLGRLYPDVARLLVAVDPMTLAARSNKAYTWRCSVEGSGHPDYRREASEMTGKKARPEGWCETCAKEEAEAKSLGSLYPEVARLLVGVDPMTVAARSGRAFTWRCSVEGSGHPNYVRKASWTTGAKARPEGWCETCAKEEAEAKSLGSLYPEVARLLVGVDPMTVAARSNEAYTWRCSVDGSNHPNYERMADQMTGAKARPDGWCPACIAADTSRLLKPSHIRAVIESLGGPEALLMLGQVERLALLQQAGLDRTATGKAIVDAVSVAGTASDLDALLGGEDDDDQDDQDDQDSDSDFDPADEPEVDEATLEEILTGDSSDAPDEPDTDEEPGLPGAVVDTVELTGNLLAGVANSADAETLDFFEASAVQKLWSLAYRADRLRSLAYRTPAEADEMSAIDSEIARTESPWSNTFAEGVRQRFRSEFDGAQAISPPLSPSGHPWSFQHVPNLMQRHLAHLVATRRRIGNFSGTGAGKTVSAVLGAAVVGAGLDGIILVLCPNDVVPGWERVVQDCYPDARVQTKTWTPKFGRGAGAKWLIVNYEMLSGYEGAISSLIAEHGIDMLVVDELHYVKVRSEETVSKRRIALEALAAEATEVNNDLVVLGMTATPSVNNLAEPKSLLEIIEGVKLDDLDTRATRSNAVEVYKRLTRFGVRWMPEYDAEPMEEHIEIDVSHLDQVLREAKGRGSAYVEQLLIEATVELVASRCAELVRSGEKVLAYTEYVEGIVGPVQEALEARGLAVGVYTGKQEQVERGGTLARFTDPADHSIQVLIGSSPISTGVDGIQRVCSNVVYVTLPWTHALYEQIRGRILRTGQTASTVRSIILIPYIDLVGDDGTVQRWSWGQYRLGKINYKKSISDAAVDGVVPESREIDDVEVTDSVLAWLDNLHEHGTIVVEREPLDGRLGDDVERLSPAAKRARFNDDFTGLNNAWARATSATTHQRLTEDPSEWRRYHDLYTTARKAWGVVPAEVFAKRLNQRKRPTVVADLGCGEGLLRAASDERHDVHGFDHVAIEDTVTVCDISNVPADDASFDVVVMSLAMMGTNQGDYLAEAHRLLDVDGQVWFAETTRSMGEGDERIADAFYAYGFDIVGSVERRGQFTFVHATKTARSMVPVRPRVKVSVERSARAA